MATPMKLPVTSPSMVLDGGNNVYSTPPRHRLRRNVKVAVLCKFIQLMLVFSCIVLLTGAAKLNLESTRLFATYATFGAYTIIPLFLITGFVIGEVTPILLVGYNLFGAVLFALVGMLGVDSYLSLLLELEQLPPDLGNAGLQRDNSMALVSAILCLLNSFLYSMDTIIEFVALRDSY